MATKWLIGFRGLNVSVAMRWRTYNIFGAAHQIGRAAIAHDGQHTRVVLRRQNDENLMRSLLRFDETLARALDHSAFCLPRTLTQRQVERRTFPQRDDGDSPLEKDSPAILVNGCPGFRSLPFVIAI